MDCLSVQLLSSGLSGETSLRSCFIFILIVHTRTPARKKKREKKITRQTSLGKKRNSKAKQMAAQTTIKVPHLGGVTAGYRLSEQPSSNKPVLVLINSMCTTSSLFDAQFASRALTDAVTLLAVEPLAHGATRCDAGGHYTYWDSAVVALQVMDGLGVREAFALGTSQGGWIVVRMALLAPERVCWFFWV